MTKDDFNYIRQLVYDRSAVVLDDGKEYLVEARLAPMVREHSLSSISDLVALLRGPSSNGLSTRVVEAMVTTETSFFRDHFPFQALKQQVLPQLISLRTPSKQLSIWSAACASGQEIYSVAMILRDFPPLKDWKINLIASDLSGSMLAQAEAGRFSQLEVNRGLPADMLVRHFRQHGLQWQIDDKLRQSIDFRRINLKETWPNLPRMDIVFLRNVLIYFDVPTKKQILNKIAALLAPGGYLVLGGAETTFMLDDSFKRVPFEKTGYFQYHGTE